MSVTLPINQSEIPSNLKHHRSVSDTHLPVLTTQCCSHELLPSDRRGSTSAAAAGGVAVHLVSSAATASKRSSGL